jgi:nucleoredoxin
MQEIVGNNLRHGAQTIDTEELKSSKFIAIYFAAHWAPPCRLFTKTLKDFYENTNKESKQVEVVFVSLDGNKDAFENNFKEMPWLAVPY